MIRTLREDDAESFLELRLAALRDAPLAFASSPEDDLASSLERVREQLRRGPDSVVFGAFEPGLVGMVGVGRDHHLKAAHKVMVWGMFVAPQQRGKGIAAALLDSAVQHARSLPGVSRAQLGVSSAAPEARRLYERAGFRVWGEEQDALRHDGRAAVEYHMALRLD